MESLIDDYCEISMESLIEEYLNAGYNIIEQSDNELHTQQQLEILNHNSKLIADLRKDLVGFQISTETHVVDSEVETDICAICQEDYEEDDNVGVLDCQHTFHHECVKTWLVVNNTCPLCKSVAVRYN